MSRSSGSAEAVPCRRVASRLDVPPVSADSPTEAWPIGSRTSRGSARCRRNKHARRCGVTEARVRRGGSGAAGRRPCLHAESSRRALDLCVSDRRRRMTARRSSCSVCARLFLQRRFGPKNEAAYSGDASATRGRVSARANRRNREGRRPRTAVFHARKVPTRRGGAKMRTLSPRRPSRAPPGFKDHGPGDDAEATRGREQ